MINQLKLSSLSLDFADGTASLRLGGVTIYARTQSELDQAVCTIGGAIDHCASVHSSLRRVTLKSQVTSYLSIKVDERVFGAILGSQLKIGILDSIPCASIMDKVFRVYVHKQQLDAFQGNQVKAAAELKRRGVAHIRDMEEILFQERQWGTFDSTIHIMARLVQVGRACYLDKKSFRWPAEVEDAINKSLRRIRVIRSGRLANS